MSTKRERCAAVAVENKINVISGKKIKNNNFTTVEVVDVDSQTWIIPSSATNILVSMSLIL